MYGIGTLTLQTVHLFVIFLVLFIYIELSITFNLILYINVNDLQTSKNLHGYLDKSRRLLEIDCTG